LGLRLTKRKKHNLQLLIYLSGGIPLDLTSVIQFPATTV